MSHTSIPPNTKLALVARAGGRCQYLGCNKRIDLDELTQKPGGFSVFAHIVADKPDGPRGDPQRSEQLNKDIENLMLLCLPCHRRIDVTEEKEHPEERLLAMKREQEERVINLLDIQENYKTQVLVYQAPIGHRTFTISSEQTRLAVLPQYPLPTQWFIDFTRTTERDEQSTFWLQAEANLRDEVAMLLRPASNRERPQHISVFGLAPIPLLMVLGRELGDIGSVAVYQKLRQPDTWSWQQPFPGDVTFEIIRPTKEPEPAKDIALLISISGRVLWDEVVTVLDKDTPCWEIRASDPKLDNVRTQTQLHQYHALYRQVLRDIRQLHGDKVTIHLFPAVPNSVAIESGLCLLPKIDPAIRIYDRNRNNSGFSYTLDLLRPFDQRVPTSFPKLKETET